MHTQHILPLHWELFTWTWQLIWLQKKELENLNKQWNRSLVVTKLAMKKAQLVNQEDVQIVSQTDNVLTVTKDTTMTPFETIKVKGVIKAPRHYKHFNVMIDDLLDGQHCKT